MKLKWHRYETSGAKSSCFYSLNGGFLMEYDGNGTWFHCFMTVLQSLNLCVNQLLHTNQLQEAFELIPESRSYFQKDIEGKKKLAYLDFWFMWRGWERITFYFECKCQGKEWDYICTCQVNKQTSVSVCTSSRHSAHGGTKCLFELQCLVLR